MFRSLAVAAVLSAAFALPATAQDRSMADVIPGYQPSALEQDLPQLEARMAGFGQAVQALASDPNLDEAEREARMAALTGEYLPDLVALTTSAADVGLTTAGTLLSTMDIGAVVAAALNEAMADIHAETH